jgi:hypothetical protein
MALQPFVRPWPLFLFLNLFTHSVGLFGQGIRPSKGLYQHTGQHKHRINAYKHSCLKWNSNLRSQCLSGRRQFMPNREATVVGGNSTLPQMNNHFLSCTSKFSKRRIRQMQMKIVMLYCVFWKYCLLSANHKEECRFLRCGAYFEDGGDTILRNVSSHDIYAVPHPRRRHSS